MSKQIWDFMKSVDVRSLSAAEAQEYLGVLADWQRQIAGAAPSMPVAPAFVRKVETPREITRHAVGRYTAPTPTPSVADLKAKSVPFGVGNFALMATRYKRAFGVNLSHGRLMKAAYAKNCQEFSEDAVLAAFMDWQKDNQWVREKSHTAGLYQFYDALPSMLEAGKLIRSDEEIVAQKKSKEESDKESAIEAGRSAALLASIRRMEQKKRDELAAKMAPEELFS